MTLIDRILSRNVIILDGATGSQLIAQGLSAGECPEYWNISHPEIIKGVAASYFDAGSDAVLTNTFGGSFLKLKSYKLEGQVYELNYQAAKHAISVKPGGKYVLGSIGPSGLMLEPYGETTEEEMTASYAFQVKAMANAGVDGFMLETFTDLGEIFCAVNAVKENSDLPFFASMTFGATPEGFKTMMGVSVEDFIVAMEGADALVIGSNCGNGIVKMVELAKEFRSISGKVNLMLKANAGEPHLHDGQLCYSEVPEVFAANLSELLKLSPSAIGGCCGTNPEHIRKIRLLLDTL